jgi:beta-glucanase (GH16 family)
VHSNETGEHTKESSAVKVPSTDGFHTYGVLWDQDQIVWYFDDVAVAHADTPSDMHGPMYMLVNLAVGGMAGEPSDAFADGSGMHIDYIHAYSLQDAPVTDSNIVHSSDWMV